LAIFGVIGWDVAAAVLFAVLVLALIGIVVPSPTD
jgi:hypothetical protein